jgi:hypothetical protein
MAGAGCPCVEEDEDSMAKVRVTVVKRVVHRDLVDRYVNVARYPDGFGLCPLWKDG